MMSAEQEIAKMVDDESRYYSGLGDGLREHSRKDYKGIRDELKNTVDFMDKLLALCEKAREEKKFKGAKDERELYERLKKKYDEPH